MCRHPSREYEAEDIEIDPSPTRRYKNNLLSKNPQILQDPPQDPGPPKRAKIPEKPQKPRFWAPVATGACILINVFFGGSVLEKQRDGQYFAVAGSFRAKKGPFSGNPHEIDTQ